MAAITEYNILKKSGDDLVPVSGTELGTLPQVPGRGANDAVINDVHYKEITRNNTVSFLIYNFCLYL